MFAMAVVAAEEQKECKKREQYREVERGLRQEIDVSPSGRHLFIARAFKVLESAWQ
jgi:hypothetical protein